MPGMHEVRQSEGECNSLISKLVKSKRYDAH